MALLKTPSVQSLLDSDLESVESLQYLDIEELDEVEYALPASEAPTLAEVLSADIEDRKSETDKTVDEPTACSALQVEFLQGVSQQLIQAQERSSTGVVTSLSVAKDGRFTVGTAHGHLLCFHDQILRWVCDSNADRGAVSCLSFSNDGTRLLAGHARGLICQYESIRGTLLRKVTLGGEIWGILRVTWAGTSGLALDTGGSVWLIKFSRPLGVRSARTSCLFSGARGEVVAMTAKDARILALATLSRVIIVAGGRAAGVRVGGPPDTLPVLEWSESDDKILVCGRAKSLQWISVVVTGSSITLRAVKRVELKTTPLWLGWLGGTLAIFDADENLRLWGADYEKPLDLSQIEPVYASAFFKGLWTDGRVSRAMCTAGVSALGGACVVNGALSLLGRRGIVRVRPRDLLARAQAFIASGHHLQALRLLFSTEGQDAKDLAKQFITHISERPHILGTKNVADYAIKLCLKYNLSEELWNQLWEQCSGENAFVEALGDAAARGELANVPPAPDATQALIERLSEVEPGLVERVVATVPLTSLDPHRATVFTRERKLWRAVGAIAATLGGGGGAVRALAAHVRTSCDGSCVDGTCPGAALVLAAADALAGRGAGGRALPAHAMPSARHDALHTLLAEQDGQSPLHVMVEHDASSAVRLLEQSARDPPFAGPLGKQNRLRVARALLAFAKEMQDLDARIEILEFITGQLGTGALPADQEVIQGSLELGRNSSGERGDRALLALLLRGTPSEMPPEQRAQLQQRPRVLWRLDAALARPICALEQFFRIERPSAVDLDDLFEYLARQVNADEEDHFFAAYLPEQRHSLFCSLVELRPRAAAALMNETFLDSIIPVLKSVKSNQILEFAECLLETGRLRGDAAAFHLRNLCEIRPFSVSEFLLKNPGTVRPEDALAIVQEMMIEDAEAMCLEATGDTEGALEAILRRVETCEDGKEASRLMSAAGELCARVAPSVPPETAAAMWGRVLTRAGSTPPPPALLLEAAAYLPVEALAGQACDHPARLALAVLACAARRRRGWACAERVAGREAHEALVRALTAARRGLAVRGRCAACSRRLATRPAIRTAHCSRAFHTDCQLEKSCGVCSARLPDEVMTQPPRPHRHDAPPPEHALLLRAPPRPDLEGVV